jgi:chromosome segregation ATPase
MGFDYDRFKAKEDDGSYWASYSDLFMVMSLVFLLLYVTASLRSGTFSIQKNIEFQQVKQENDDLKQQIQVYSTLKDDYLQTGATKEESQVYEELMGKLSLLQEEAKDEKDKLRRAAAENEAKEQALNKYQQMIRNIVNTNLISQARIKKRETIITKKDEVIEAKVTEINTLEKSIDQKEKEIKASENEIKKVNKELQSNIAQLQTSFKQNKITKEKMQSQIAKLKQESEQEMQQLAERSEQYKQELQQVSSQLGQASEQLQVAQATIADRENVIQEIEQEKEKYKNEMGQIQSKYEERIQSAQEKFESELQKQQLTATEKIQKQAEFAGQMEKQQRRMQQELAAVQGKVAESQKQLDQALTEKSRFAASVQNLKKEKTQLSQDLAEAQEVENAKKRLIERIQNNLQRAGLKAQVDGKTGDVIITFGDEYFDTGKASLKPGMTQILQKFMPVYSKSLLEDKKTAEKIESVEIIGFASPTYKGKYVDPVSLQAQDREAANFNLDLSYYRARSIFDHIFDTSKMSYQHQRDLLPLVKVSGRSFFAAGSEKDVANGISEKDYCKKYDCKSSQKVIIKFDMAK